MARLLAVLVRDVIVCEALTGPCGGPGRVLRPVLFKPELIVIVMMDLTQLRSQPLYGIVNRLDIVIVVL